LHLSEALCERELDLEVADILPHRDTLGLLPANITVAPDIAVAVVTGAAVATQVLTNDSSNIAAVSQYVNLTS
jgi:hypothetical protein